MIHFPSRETMQEWDQMWTKLYDNMYIPKPIEKKVIYETVEQFYNARWRKSYREGINELIMDPVNQPERRVAQTIKNDFDYKSQEAAFKSIEEKLDDFMVDEVDMVDHPPHYNSRSMEVADIIDVCLEGEPNNSVAYPMNNVLKYVLRFRGKNGVEDLKKAKWYLDRMIIKVEEEG